MTREEAMQKLGELLDKETEVQARKRVLAEERLVLRERLRVIENELLHLVGQVDGFGTSKAFQEALDVFIAATRPDSELSNAQ